jgi:hypothetical protein
LLIFQCFESKIFKKLQMGEYFLKKFSQRSDIGSTIRGHFGSSFVLELNGIRVP